MHLFRYFPWFLATALLLIGNVSHAQRDATLQAFERLEESLGPKVEEGSLSSQGIGPVLLVRNSIIYTPQPPGIP